LFLADNQRIKNNYYRKFIMASLYKEKTAQGMSYRIQFCDDNKRCSIRLGAIPKKLAETILSKVEEIIICSLSGGDVSQETASWIGKLPDKIYSRLSRAGLVPHRKSTELNTYIQAYIENRHDVKVATHIRWNTVRQKLIGYFGECCKADSITSKNANEYRQSLFKDGLARATISKYLTVTRMFFNEMLKDGLIQSNPFATVRERFVVDDTRNVYVPREDVYVVMEAAPDAEWRLIIALSRFGGLRCPTEVLSLKWENIHWANNRIIVPSPKTEHHPNGAQRVIPLFPELIEPLRDVERTKPAEAIYVISKHRSRADVSDSWADSNLREPMLDILKRAKIKPWPKLFHAMRASCETDLVQDGNYPLKAVTTWMGHSYKVAEKHYLRVTEDEFDRAVKFGAVKSGNNVSAINMDMQNAGESEVLPADKPVQKAVQQASARGCLTEPRKTKSPYFTGFCDSVQRRATDLIGQVGLEPTTKGL
jgi:Integrase